MPDPSVPDPPEPSGESRRGFLSKLSTWFMLGGLASGYGACAAIGARYLYPARRRAMRWLFVARLDELKPGDSLSYRAPTGEEIAIARQGGAGTAEDFVALSSICPHLGCKVHWEPHNTRFFCPCHNGVFDPLGTAISGPPADDGQSLPRYALKVEGGLLFIEVPVEALGGGLALGSGADGRDPCLERGARRDPV